MKGLARWHANGDTSAHQCCRCLHSTCLWMHPLLFFLFVGPLSPAFNTVAGYLRSSTNFCTPWCHAPLTNLSHAMYLLSSCPPSAPSLPYFFASCSFSFPIFPQTVLPPRRHKHRQQPTTAVAVLAVHPASFSRSPIRATVKQHRNIHTSKKQKKLRGTRSFTFPPSSSFHLLSTMSGFTVRRFVLQNITAVAAHCPSQSIAAAALAVMTGHTAPITTTTTSASGADRGAAASSSSASSPSSTTTSKPSTRVSGWVQGLLLGSAASGARGFGLVTEAEMAYIRQRRLEDAEESRVVLATRPGRSILRGAAGAVFNSLLGFVVSPLVSLSVMLEKIRLGSGPSALLIGPCYGFLWGGVFFACAQYAAVQQAVLCAYYSCVATPLYYCVNRRPRAGASGAASRPRAWVFGVLSCRFEPPQGTLHAHHPMLLLYDEPSVLRERAMKRLASRDKKDRDKDGVKYAGKGKAANQGPDDDDYYGLLGITPDATARQVKSAYSEKALHLHPDRNPSPTAAQDFDRVTKAYRVLSNPAKRKKFDLAGTKGVEDTGVKKREGVRALFGGEELNRLTGDVFLGSFSRRVIDGLDFTAEELAIVRQCMYESCRDELLGTYLAYYEPSATAGGSANTKATTAAAKHASTSSAGLRVGPWKEDVLSLQLRKMLNTGLAKEVLYTLGHEYKRVLACFAMETTTAAAAAAGAAVGSGSATLTTTTTTRLPSLAIQRARFFISVIVPHRWHLQRQKLTYLAKVRSHTFKNSEAMVDLAWYTSVQELETTARTVATMILYDPTQTAEEAATRRDALAALADTFVKYGQPYKGASKATMDQLMQSLREYQEQKQREKDAE